MHKVACRARLLNYTTGIPPEAQRNLFVEPLASVEAGVEQALQHHGPDATIAVIPEGPYVLACLADDLVGSKTVRGMVAG
jgi:nickel-dependent lactate racemase